MEIIQQEKGLIQSFNKVAEVYDEATNDFSHKIMEYINLNNLTKELGKDNGGTTLLDLGGGTGKYSIIFSKMGYKVTLADISDKSLKIAENKFKREKLLISTVNASGEMLPMEDMSFDFVIMLGGVISYTPNPCKLINECKRVLKKDGMLYFDFFNSLGWCNEINDIGLRLEIIEKEKELLRMDDWDYPAQVFNYRYIENMVKNSGFKIKSKYGLINVTTSLPMEIRYGKQYEQDLLERYKTKELELSRDPECYGTSWSCTIVATK